MARLAREGRANSESEARGGRSRPRPSPYPCSCPSRRPGSIPSPRARAVPETPEGVDVPPETIAFWIVGGVRSTRAAGSPAGPITEGSRSVASAAIRSRNAAATSAPEPGRASGSFARSRRISDSSAGEIAGFLDRGGSGGLLTWLAITASDGPWNGGEPVEHS